MTETVISKFVEEQPKWDGTVWIVRSHHIYQPVCYLGTLIGRKVQNGIRLCGSDPTRPRFPEYFGNYSDVHFEIAAAMLFFKLKPSDIEQFGLITAGSKVGDQPRLHHHTEYPGLIDRVTLAYRVLKYAPLHNKLVRNFKKTERWQTIFEGSIPLTWAEPGVS